MRAALVYLLFNSWRNRLTVRLRRLRQPKYLAGAVVGGLYLYFYFFKLFVFPPGSRTQPTGFGVTPEDELLYESIGACILLVILLLAWLIPHERAALVFTEAEIAFLFPAPVKRKTLIHYKLLKSQIGILFTTLIFTLLFRNRGTGANGWTRALGWWMIFSTLNLHFLGSSFARTILLEKGVSNWKRRIVVLGLLGAGAVAVLVWCQRSLPGFDLKQVESLTDLKVYAEQALSSGPLPYLLYPLRLVVRPYVSPDFHSFLVAAGPALALIALHYIWVVRANVAFEEASVEASQKIAERIANIRANRGLYTTKPKKKKRPPFELRPMGPTPIALLWKNLIGAGQAFTFRFWLLCIWIAFLAIIMSTLSSKTFSISFLIGSLAAMFLVMSFVLGPQLVRQDFRTDLPMADVLKAYPMKGWQVALGELLAPAVILTFVQWLLIMISAGLVGHPDWKIPVQFRLAFAAGLAILAPALNMVTLLIPNAAVLMFPTWFQPEKDSPQGIEATGQRLIFALGQIVMVIVAVVPAVLFSVLVYLLASSVAGPYLPIPIAALCAACIMAAEAWLGLLWLGQLFERFDLTAE